MPWGSWKVSPELRGNYCIMFYHVDVRERGAITIQIQPYVLVFTSLPFDSSFFQCFQLSIPQHHRAKSLKLAAFVSLLHLCKVYQAVNAMLSLNMLNSYFSSSEYERQHCVHVWCLQPSVLARSCCLKTERKSSQPVSGAWCHRSPGWAYVPFAFPSFLKILN